MTALKLVSGATGNVFYRGLLLKITDLVAEGASLSRAMKTVGHFPAELRDLVKVGEQTGDLGGVMAKIGERYEKDIKKRIDTIMQIVPLLITAALGAWCSSSRWSMLDGIFQAMHGLQGRHYRPQIQVQQVAAAVPSGGARRRLEIPSNATASTAARDGGGYLLRPALSVL